MQFLKTTLFERDVEYLKTHNPRLLKRIKPLCLDIELHPFECIGKPEALEHQFTGVWSRRIDKQNRLLYMLIDDETVKLLSCYGHYK